MKNKAELLKAELAKMGIYTDEDLKEAMKKEVLNISAMAAVKERMVG